MVSGCAMRSASASRACDEIIHCAASVSFDLPLDEARAVNTAGAARVAELAARTAVRGNGLRRIVHVSTAYVAGQRTGTFGEDQMTIGLPFRNTYEQTKHEAEQLLRGGRRACRCRSCARASSSATGPRAGPGRSTSSTGR